MVRKLVILLGCLTAAAHALASPVMTSFNPQVSGYHFANSFSRDFMQANIKFYGYCGGMTYGALDNYNAHRPAPAQSWIPMNGTALEGFLWDRQLESVTSNIDKWTEVIFNPAGARDSEFFNWGLEIKPGSRIMELKSFIDRGIPVPLGLKGAGGSGDHQVLAIGYDMGAYNGTNPSAREQFQIFTYNPNYPDRTMVLRAKVSEQVFIFDGTQDKYRTWFVNKNYHAHTPPNIPSASFPRDGKAHMVVLTFYTGGDDLRGDPDNLDVTINFMDGRQQKFMNVNKGQRWVDNSVEAVELMLQNPCPSSNIQSIELYKHPEGGISPDNWNLDVMTALAFGNGVNDDLGHTNAYRFTNDRRQLTLKVRDRAAIPNTMISGLSLTFQTADDDLRGGDDNLDVTVVFTDNSFQRFDNVNRGANWGNNSTNRVTLTFTAGHLWNTIRRVSLYKHASGGFNGDNWNMQKVTINAMYKGGLHLIGSHDFFRFTGDAKDLLIPIRTNLPYP